MCGIIGVESQFNFNEELFKQSLELIKHRGPDNQEVEKINPKAALGHTRLSILDLSIKGNQPYRFKNLYLTYNGEIYNFKEIRNELIQLNFSFESNSDTEVLIKGFYMWGHEILNKLNGMFAFTIYNYESQEYFCARDRFGIKPFHYYLDGKRFIFSSEIKPIINYFPDLKQPNLDYLNQFLVNGDSGQNEETSFSSILRLRPGHYMIVKNLALITYKKYWEYPNQRNSSLSFNEAKKKFSNLINKSVELRMRSDVEVASTITSGIDSTTIVSIIAEKSNIDTFTSFSQNEDFKTDEKKIFNSDVNYNESDSVNLLNKDINFNPTFIKFEMGNTLERLKSIVYRLENPHHSKALLQVDKLYENVSKKHKVLMEGQGADELLGGYVNEFFPFFLKDSIRKLDFKNAYSNIKYLIETYGAENLIKSYLNSLSRYNKLIFYLKKKTNRIDNLTHQKIKFKRGKKIKDMLISRHNSGLVNLLYYGDMLSMSHSIENRFPFMDHNLVEFCLKLPLKYLFKNGFGKYILRDFSNKKIPDEILWNKYKLGYTSPYVASLKYDNQIRDFLYTADDLNYFNQANLTKLLDEFYQNKYYNTSVIYKILMIKIWINCYFTKDGNCNHSKNMS